MQALESNHWYISKERIDDVENRKIIRKSSPPKASPIFAVAKGENDVRLVPDCRMIHETNYRQCLDNFKH